MSPGLTSRERGGRAGQSRTDLGDATGMARIVAREPDLPAVRLAVGAAADLRVPIGTEVVASPDVAGRLEGR